MPTEQPYVNQLVEDNPSTSFQVACSELLYHHAATPCVHNTFSTRCHLGVYYLHSEFPSLGTALLGLYQSCQDLQAGTCWSGVWASSGRPSSDQDDLCGISRLQSRSRWGASMPFVNHVYSLSMTLHVFGDPAVLGGATSIFRVLS